jgi:ATP-dependent protease ClpP protease subunit
MIHIENKSGKLKLDDQVDKFTVRELVEQINRVFGANAAQAGLVTGEIVNCIENAADTLEIEINSPGGSVLDGYTLYNAIKDMRDRGVHVTARIQLAASMASVIAMAADHIVMLEGARMMIHEASTVTAGDADKHMQQAELLESISDEIAGIYASRTGKDRDEVRDLMKKETWMDGKQAVALGFANETFDKGNKQQQAMNIIDRLTNPSADEAHERIVALESQIASNDQLVADFQAKLEVAENALQEATTQLTTLKAQIEETAEKLEDAEKTVTEQAEKIEELEKAAEETEEKVSARAAELLAATGHPAPLPLASESSTSTNHLEIMDKLPPAEAAAYFVEHKNEILSNQNRYRI